MARSAAAFATIRMDAPRVAGLGEVSFWLEEEVERELPL